MCEAGNKIKSINKGLEITTVMVDEMMSIKINSKNPESTGLFFTE